MVPATQAGRAAWLNEDVCHPQWRLALERLTSSCCFRPCVRSSCISSDRWAFGAMCGSFCVTGLCQRPAGLGLTSAQCPRSQHPPRLLCRWVGRGGLLLQKSDLETWALKRGSPARVTLSAFLPDLGARHQLAALPQHHLLPRGDQ